MTDERDARSDAWFDRVDPGDVAAAAGRISDGRADAPADWPGVAVEAGVVADEEAYYEFLHEATVEAARSAARERERADDRQLVHAVRALDDCERTANELAERVVEWAGTRLEDVPRGVDGARSVAERADERTAGTVDDRVAALARRVRDLDDEADALRASVERTAPSVAPNLSALAGPVLATRLIALAGGLEDLAKLPSGTVQVLGAEDALFAHLGGDAPSPKHGVIYTHEAVRNTRRADRGSAARALAGKLTLAARVDHYSGERRPDLDRQLADRIERIHAREDR
jgi:nucleolar protein 56